MKEIFDLYIPRSERERTLIKEYLKENPSEELILKLIKALENENPDNSEELDELLPLEISSKMESPTSVQYHWSQKHVQRVVDSGSGGAVYLLGEQEEEIPLTLDPHEADYVTFYDVTTDFKEADSTDKGRSCPPISVEDVPDIILGDGRKVIGADIARFGDDKTCLVIRHGIHVIDIQTYVKSDVVSTAQKVMDAVDEYNPDELVIDITGGLGAGVVDTLKKDGIDSKVILTEVIFNSVPRDETLNPYNSRAEMYLLLQERFRKGEITIPPHKELAEQLAIIRYEYSSESDKIKMVPKAKLKKRYGQSPDIADGIALAFYSKPELQIY